MKTGLTIRRRPRWLAARTRMSTATLAAVVAATATVAGSVIGVAHAAPDADTPPAAATPPSATTPGVAPTTTPPRTGLAQRPGTVYANRDVPGTGLIPGAGQGNQFTYWSVGADEQPHLTTGSLFLPDEPAPRGGYPIIAWAHGSRGIADACAPSVRPTTDDLDTLRTWLGRGYAVVSTDYAGLGTAGTPQYYDIEATAHNVIDAVRASRDISDQLSRKWAVVGESQGGSAAVALARLAPGIQGPTLAYQGSAATSIPADFASLLSSLGPTTTSMPAELVTDALYTLSAIRSSRPALELDSYLTNVGRTWMSKAATLCAADLTRQVEGLPLGSLFAKPLSENRELTSLLTSASTLPTRGFARPVMMTQTLQDQSVVVPLTLKYINEARLADRRVDARIYLTPDPVQAERMGDNDTRQFMARILR